MKIYRLGDHDGYSLIQTDADCNTIEKVIELVKESIEDYSDHDVITVLQSLDFTASILLIEASINF